LVSRHHVSAPMKARQSRGRTSTRPDSRLREGGGEGVFSGLRCSARKVVILGNHSDVRFDLPGPFPDGPAPMRGHLLKSRAS